MDSPSLFDVGYAVRRFGYPAKQGVTKEITLAVWYPTSDPPRNFRYHGLWLSGKVALEGKVHPGRAPYPLLVFSHGYMGCATQSSYLLEHLAARGYVVAAPDHDDARLCAVTGAKKNFQKLDFRKSMLENVFGRLADVRAVIDEMLRLNEIEASPFRGAVDPEAIGALGHSLGGWTCLALSGAMASHHDPRLKAVLLMAAFLKEFDPEDYRRIRIPAMHLIGENDRFTHQPLIGFLLREPKIARRAAFDYGESPRYLVVVKEANHFTFTDYTCFFYKSIENCQRDNPKARVIIKYASAFLDLHLKNRTGARSLLEEPDPYLIEYEQRPG